MGWELRNGRRYLYRNRRVGGRPVKQYLAADGAFGRREAARLARELAQRGAARRAGCEEAAAYTERIDALVQPAVEADARLKAAAEALLLAAGFHKHRRQWRKRRVPMGSQLKRTNRCWPTCWPS